MEYPPESVWEIVTNAVIHRDYSISDHIHVQVFDNRIEVKSPGNKEARDLTGIRSENSMKNVFLRLQQQGHIEPVAGLKGSASRWQLKQ